MGRGAAVYGVEHEAAVAAEVKRVTAWIGAHLFEELSVATIARACGLSAFHFSRRFSALHGESVMAYVRGERLVAAARRLARDPAISLAEIALECRYASQPAFTRAFTRAFGHPPGEGRGIRAQYIRNRRGRMTPKPVLIESIKHRDAFRVAGFSARFEPSTYTEIPDLWKRLGAQLGFPGQIGGGETVGAFRDRNPDTRSFEHLAGVRVTDGAASPPSFVTWTLPAQTWLVFRQMLTEQALHLQMLAAETEIKGERIRRSGRTLASSPDFQIYPANFKLGAGGWVEHWLPLKDE